MSHKADGNNRTILVFNVGSSSLTFKLYRDSNVLMRGKCYRVGITGASQAFVEVQNDEVQVHDEVDLPDHLVAARYVLDYCADSGYTFEEVGHRFAGGGGYFGSAVVVDDGTRPLLDRCLPLAPLHNAAALHMIDLVADRHPGVPQYVVFDLTFHACMPDVARTYALSGDLVQKYQKHGFHGLSYADVREKASWYLGESRFRAVALHLGTGGSSACAISDGCSRIPQWAILHCRDW